MQLVLELAAPFKHHIERQDHPLSPKATPGRHGCIGRPY
jgi:ribosomal protein S4E